MGGRPVGDGDAAERHHARRRHRPGLRRRHALRAVLLRTADRDDHPLADAGAVLLPGPRLHRLRVPREALRHQDADAREPAVPALARPVVRRHHRGAGRHSLDRARLEHHADDPGDRSADGALHDRRRRPGGHLDRRQADGRHHRRRARGRDRAARRTARRRERWRRAAGGGRRRTVEHGRLQLRLVADLHLLVGTARRPVPDAVVFRLRSEPGAALPDGEVGRRGPPVAADERVLQDPAAGAGAADRRAGVRLLPLQPAADAVQRQACGGDRARAHAPAEYQQLEAQFAARVHAASGRVGRVRVSGGDDGAARTRGFPRRRFGT